MGKVNPGYMTAEIEGDFVVFLIGMRINKPWKLHKWFPVARAITPMLTQLSRSKNLGLLGFTSWVAPSGPLLVQYWRTVEQLEAFAKDPALTHRPAWKRFNQQVGASGDVGVWHETYMVHGGTYETIYANMPTFGLGKAGQNVPVARATRQAADRRAAHRSA